MESVDQSPFGRRWATVQWTQETTSQWEAARFAPTRWCENYDQHRSDAGEEGEIPRWKAGWGGMDVQRQHADETRESGRQVASGMELARAVRREWVCVAP